MSDHGLARSFYQAALIFALILFMLLLYLDQPHLVLGPNFLTSHLPRAVYWASQSPQLPKDQLHL